MKTNWKIKLKIETKFEELLLQKLTNQSWQLKIHIGSVYPPYSCERCKGESKAFLKWGIILNDEEKTETLCYNCGVKSVQSLEEFNKTNFKIDEPNIKEIIEEITTNLTTINNNETTK